MVVGCEGMLTAGRGRLAGVDVTNDDDVDMSLLLTARRSASDLSRWRARMVRTPWLRI